MNNVKRRSLGKQQEVDLVDDEAVEISERERWNVLKDSNLQKKGNVKKTKLEESGR